MNAILKSGHLLLSLLLPAALCAQGLQVTGGARLILNGNIKLVLHNAGLTNNGNIVAGNAAVYFTGTENARIAGINKTSFDEVTVSKQSGGAVVLLQDIGISGRIVLNAGNVLLNGHTLDLASSGSIFGERAAARITGVNGRILLTRKAPDALDAFNPGNIGLEITTPVAPGIIVIERQHLPEQLATGVQSIQRSFTISSTVNTDMNATVRFFYLGNELGGHHESSLLLWMKSDTDNSWFPLRSAVDINANSLTVDGLGHWNRFTAADPNPDSLLLQNDIKKTADLTTRIYPNPSRNIITMELFSSREKDVVLGLYDQQGRILKTRKTHIIKGMNRVQWDLGHYASGVYYVVFDNEHIKITKQ